ncbi:MAG TPA: lysophospholipid acyltransferase family protein [Acetobacteraceae bacterium]|nr:lysophospholipid acyltransferase family protein [Acetobacteraceae bacterium]
MLKRLTQSAAAQTALARLVGAYLAFALRTTRWTFEGAEHLAPHAAGAPAVVAFWHERLLLTPSLRAWARRVKPERQVFVLVSRHRDGRFIGEAIGRFGAGVVHGSSSRDGKDKGGAAGVRALLGLLRQQHLIAITPDGPRGPRRQAALGVAQLAALAGVPVLATAVQTTRRLTLGTWDRMVLPLPFGRGAIVCRPAITVPRHGAEAALPEIEAALTAAVDRADALCRP